MAAGRASPKRLKAALARTIKPLANAFDKDPRKEKTDYGPLIAEKMSKDTAKLVAAVDAGNLDLAAPLDV